MWSVCQQTRCWISVMEKEGSLLDGASRHRANERMRTIKRAWPSVQGDLYHYSSDDLEAVKPHNCIPGNPIFPKRMTASYEV